jgi:hypothetical protein
MEEIRKTFESLKEKGMFKDYPTYEDWCARNETAEQREVREKKENYNNWKNSREDKEQIELAYKEGKHKDLKLEEKWDAN